LVAVVVLFLAASGASGKSADDDHLPADSTRWSGWLSGGGFLDVGNVSSMRLNARSNVSCRMFNPWSSLQINGSASYGETRDERYLERISVEPMLEYYLTERDFCRFGIYWKRDYFAGISHADAVLLGAGRKLVNSDVVYLTGELGAMYEQMVSTSDSVRNTSKAFSGLEIAWEPSRTLSFAAAWSSTHDLRDMGNWDFEGIVNTENLLAEHLSLLVGYEVHYYNRPPAKLDESVDMSLSVELKVSM
jgi:putative salt-induced outer membrane protein YdiY